MRKLSLFSGIGGDDLASEWAGIQTICFVENNKYCQKVLKKHWPGIPIIGEVKDVTRERIMAYATSKRLYNQENEQELEREGSSKLLSLQSRNRIDIISGGFPCQPHSVAGQRKGSADERNLWPEFRRVIGEIKPRWVVAENVSGIFSSDAGRFFGAILNDLAEMGYSVGWATFGAVDIGALHRRNRVFIVAYTNNASTARQREYGRQGLPFAKPKESSKGNTSDTNSKGLEKREEQDLLGQFSTAKRSSIIADPDSEWQQQQKGELGEIGRRIADGNWWAVEPNVGRVADGVSSRVDRLRAIGNAVVPQQIYPIYKAIADIEESR